MTIDVWEHAKWLLPTLRPKHLQANLGSWMSSAPDFGMAPNFDLNAVEVEVHDQDGGGFRTD